MPSTRGLLLPLVALVALVACSSREPTREATPDAGAARSHEPTTLRALTVLRTHAPEVLARAGRPLRSSGVEGRFELPSRANGAARLEVLGQRHARVDATAVDLRDVPGVQREGAIVFPDVAPSTDVVFVADDSMFEELRILHDSSAPTRFSWRLGVDAAVDHVREREGRVELVDATGYVRLATAPLVAIDADGARRFLTVQTRRCGGEWCADAALDPAGLAYPIVVDPLWTSAPTMKNVHENARLFKLPNGKIFIGGGVAPTCEVLDATYNTWTDLGQPPGQPRDFGVVQDSNGDMLIVGGLDGANAAISAVKKYVAATGAWATAPSVNYGGSNAAPDTQLVLMSNGRVLKYGFEAYAPSASYRCEIYDGTKWTINSGPTAAGALGVTRSYPARSAVNLPDGRVFFAIGSVGPTIYFHVTYDPATDTWLRTSSDPAHAAAYTGASTPVATLLADGRVLLTDGPMGASTAAVVYTPKTSTVAEAWTTTGAQVRARHWGNAVRLGGGRVLLATGGDGTFSPDTVDYLEAEIYDPMANQWTAVEPLPPAAGVQGAAMTALADGRVLIAGGQPKGSYSNLTFFYKPVPNGQACSYSGFGCASATCAEGVCCEKASCGAGFTCASTAYPGKCVKVLGQSCGADPDCGSGHCVDGVCCDSACSGLCQRCNGATPGICVNQAGAPLPTRGACPAGGPTACSQYTCDGKNPTACVFATSTTPCSANQCVGGVETHASFCDGKGACADAPKVCAPYVCGGGVTCVSSCATSAECGAGAYCKVDKCVPLEGLGGKCAVDGDCGTGVRCVENVCCSAPGGASACPAGSTCAAPGRQGTCVKRNGTVCADGTECASGHCVDGVCCDAACNGQCEACDVVDSTSGQKGKCVPVAGAPHGARGACAKETGAAVCASAQCDGTTTTSCAGFAGSETACRDDGCVDGVFTSAATCNGSGKCPDPVIVPCGGYACSVDGKRCRADCAQPLDCTAGYSCRGGVCAKIAATCSADGLSSTPLGGTPVSCAPFVCDTDGTCRSDCATSNDCAPGNLCDSASRQCTPAPADGESSGGCATGAGEGASTPLAVAALASFGLALAARRRRAP